MNSIELKEIRKTIKELREKKILIFNLDIVFELDCQLGTDLNDIKEEDYLKLYEDIEHAYLKLEDVSLETIVYCAISNKDKILNEDEDFDLREEVCYYV